MNAPFQYEIRTARNNSVAIEVPSDQLRVVWIGYVDDRAGGADICHVPSFADSDAGNETAELITDALNAFLREHPERVPYSWANRMGSAVRRSRA